MKGSFNMQLSKIEVDKQQREIIKYENGDFPFLIFTDDFCNFDEGYIRWHWHKDLQISYVVEDKICFQVNGETIVLNPGEGILFNSNVLHQIKPYYQNCKMISIMFNQSIISGSDHSLISKKYVDTVINSHNLDFVIFKNDVNWQSEILKYVKDIYSSYKNKDYAYELEIANNLNIIWLKLVKNLKDKIQSPSKKVSADDERVKTAINYIKTNYARDISLDDIAKSCNISKSECCRSFRRILKMTPFEYLMEYRVLKATEYLYNTDEPISNICINVGFNGISYFGKTFKKFMHCTPSQYRANMKKKWL